MANRELNGMVIMKGELDRKWKEMVVPSFKVTVPAHRETDENQKNVWCFSMNM
jgi:hypothetical protein